MIDVATAVESYVQDALQLALEFDGSDAVRQLWVYAAIDDDQTDAEVFYLVADAVLSSADICNGDEQTHRHLLGALNELVDELAEAFEKTGQAPTRIVVSWDAETQDADADFNYDELRDDDDQTLAQVRQAWLDILTSTGEADA